MPFGATQRLSKGDLQECRTDAVGLPESLESESAMDARHVDWCQLRAAADSVPHSPRDDRRKTSDLGDGNPQVGELRELSPSVARTKHFAGRIAASQLRVASPSRIR